jgi:hypothetical protein|eukprot:COSAG02_NODE_2733_length_8136_cov_35.604454_6_plen_54_part_00
MQCASVLLSRLASSAVLRSISLRSNRLTEPEQHSFQRPGQPAALPSYASINIQ